MLLRRLRDCVDQAGGGLGLAVEEGLPEPSRDESSLPEMSRGRAEDGLGQLRARSLGQLFGRVLAAQQSEADGRVGEHLAGAVGQRRPRVGARDIQGSTEEAATSPTIGRAP